MVRLIMAAIGLLFVVIGGNLNDDNLIVWGVFLLLPALVTVVWKIAKKVSEHFYWKKRMDEIKIDEENRRLADAKRKQELLEEQKNLVLRYTNSPMVQEVLKIICKGDPHRSLPEEIVIYNDKIQARLGKEGIVFDFAAHRVYSFPNVIKTVFEKKELQYVVRPQVAMAEALNCLLAEQYEIYDNAKQDYNSRTDSDGDRYTTITYISDHVTMILKSTLPNKTF